MSTALLQIKEHEYQLQHLSLEEYSYFLLKKIAISVNNFALKPNCIDARKNNYYSSDD